ncbi:MAG: 5-oxoprolinase subunit PxpB [Lachnospiraceae bacterium]|nr:5-oxoprolinase subunit PxpB [Lachnospiraceae bacterium]
MEGLRILPAGDRALVAEFGNIIDEGINNQVHALAKKLASEAVPGVLELVPTFRSLLIYYDPSSITYHDLAQRIRQLSESSAAAGSSGRRIWRIPCCYGSHFGPDLPALIRYTGLSRDEIIAIHSSVDYKIYMLGFLPGFVYLGGLDNRIEIPRLPSPRVRIPKGSVGIGGNQTGVYPLDSPGGWRLIGSTPVDFYDPQREKPILCDAGDYIRFVPITSSDYYDIRQMILRGTYRLTVQEGGGSYVS